MGSAKIFCSCSYDSILLTLLLTPKLFLLVPRVCNADLAYPMHHQTGINTNNSEWNIISYYVKISQAKLSLLVRHHS